ncbi:hypothetical protein BVG16_04685 [Paenibacillus selenitireducens]|uniref:DUF58 domain-containing protein n=1 Tax=Paenibacillus selenitireducens TaxID=1324314 RepID=A0A1T2XJI3_9BACL|nr:DUF58 domain-containing protein [Paenibacillus selenitireducens]OPA80051.1 hypothetical protein BVG16_04685 [Paenibacillus selenitireducens]
MPLHWLILFAILALGFQGWIFKKRGLARVTYTRSFTKQRLFVGDHVEMTETIGNDKLLPVPWVRLESMISSTLVFGHQTNLDIHAGELLQNHKSLFTLKPYTQIVRRHDITVNARGIYHLQSATMTAGDVFGVFDSVRMIPLDLELTVFPEIIAMRDIPFSNKSWIGDITVRRWMLEDPFWKSGVRPYLPGDSLKSVHWKATARTNQLQVHQFDYTADRKLMILVNFETTERMWSKVTRPEAVERALSYAASIANVTVTQGIETGFACNGTTKSLQKGQAVILPPGAGSHHLTNMFETMAQLELELSSSFHTFLESWEDSSGTDFILITPIPLIEVENKISRMRMRGNGVEIIEIPVRPLTSAAAKEADDDAKQA